MSPAIRLGPHVELPTDVTWISVIAKSDWFRTRSVPPLLSELHPAIATEPSTATTQTRIRRFRMARTSSNDRAVGADCRTRSCTAVSCPTVANAHDGSALLCEDKAAAAGSRRGAAEIGSGDALHRRADASRKRAGTVPRKRA